MLILGIDSATAAGSVALARDGVVLAEQALQGHRGRARDLVAEIDRLLARAAVRREEISAVGVTVGPGSFTGVRVGMATAKGIAYALDIGIAGLSSLEALARAAAATLPAPLPVLCPVLEAGRGEIYAALFEAGSGGLERRREDRSWRPADLLEALPAGVLLVGDGSGAVAQAARNASRPTPAAGGAPLLAATVALHAGAILPPGARYQPGSPAPNYIRPTDAEAARRRP